MPAPKFIDVIAEDPLDPLHYEIRECLAYTYITGSIDPHFGTPFIRLVMDATEKAEDKTIRVKAPYIEAFRLAQHPRTLAVQEHAARGFSLLSTTPVPGAGPVRTRRRPGCGCSGCANHIRMSQKIGGATAVVAINHQGFVKQDAA